MWHCVTGCIVSSISNNHCAFIIKVSLDSLALMMKELQSYETLWTTLHWHSVTSKKNWTVSNTTASTPVSCVWYYTAVKAHICTIFQHHHLIYWDICTSVWWDYPHPCNHTLCHDSWTSIVDPWLQFQVSFSINCEATLHGVKRTPWQSQG